MDRVKWQRLVLIAAIALAAGWVLTRMALNGGYTPSPVPWTVPIISVLGGVLALIFAWPVRQYQQGKRPGLDGLRAARAAVFAQACAYAGVLLAGGFGGYAIGVAAEWAHEPRREVAISALIAVLGGVLLLAGGLVAEHWCRTKPPEEPKVAAAP